ncbi:hypothetical protein BaRGS_00008000 [Batillaria attramentaria]|uniref:Uncharacterized protein n=1 Tax=Batillaria attramentaria TaxID=370345 RepID=A0ABD0LMQ8_9CAEN
MANKTKKEEESRHQKSTIALLPLCFDLLTASLVKPHRRFAYHTMLFFPRGTQAENPSWHKGTAEKVFPEAIVAFTVLVFTQVKFRGIC